MNGKKAFKVFPDIAGNAMDYFFNRNALTTGIIFVPLSR